MPQVDISAFTLPRVPPSPLASATCAVFPSKTTAQHFFECETAEQQNALHNKYLSISGDIMISAHINSIVSSADFFRPTIMSLQR